MVAGIALCECGQSLQGPLGGQHLLRCAWGSERNNTPRGGNSRFETCHVQSKTPHLACFARFKTVLKCFKMVEKRLKDVLFMIYILLLIFAHMLQLCRLEATNLLQITPKYVKHMSF
jgi:hypothetical protein